MYDRGHALMARQCNGSGICWCIDDNDDVDDTAEGGDENDGLDCK